MYTLHNLNTHLVEILKSKMVFQKLLSITDQIFGSLVLHSDCIFLSVPKLARFNGRLIFGTLVKIVTKFSFYN